MGSARPKEPRCGGPKAGVEFKGEGSQPLPPARGSGERCMGTGIGVIGGNSGRSARTPSGGSGDPGSPRGFAYI